MFYYRKEIKKYLKTTKLQNKAEVINEILKWDKEIDEYEVILNNLNEQISDLKFLLRNSKNKLYELKEYKNEKNRWVKLCERLNKYLIKKYKIKTLEIPYPKKNNSISLFNSD